MTLLQEARAQFEAQKTVTHKAVKVDKALPDVLIGEDGLLSVPVAIQSRSKWKKIYKRTSKRSADRGTEILCQPIQDIWFGPLANYQGLTLYFRGTVSFEYPSEESTPEGKAAAVAVQALINACSDVDYPSSH